MFELSVAWKYLTPRWRQLSVSIISLISIFVIALVVWLIVVFFSVTHGLEKGWIQKLTALTAPVRITPTDAYYHSYYYQIDSASESSNYTLKSIGEKLKAAQTNPYDSSTDMEPPSHWPAPDLKEDGSLKDLAKSAFQIASALPNAAGLTVSDFEVAVGSLRLQAIRNDSSPTSLSQATYLGTYEPHNDSLLQTLQPITVDDLNRSLATYSSFPNDDDSFDVLQTLRYANITALKTPSSGWVLPRKFWPKEGTLQGICILRDVRITEIVIPLEISHLKSIQQSLENQGYITKKSIIAIKDGIISSDSEIIPPYTPLIIEGNSTLPASIVENSLKKARFPSDIRFVLNTSLQGHEIQGEVPYSGLLLGVIHPQIEFSAPPFPAPLWAYQQVGLNGTRELVLPSNPKSGEGVLLPKAFKDNGVSLGARGHLFYYAATTSSVQEQQLPIYVAGFYDPGIMPIGGKYVIANQGIINLIRSSQNQENNFLSNGMNVRFDHLEDAPKIKETLEKEFRQKGIDKYWKVETYEEYEFTKDLIQQLHSERNLWTLIATVIIIVACSNIISMLIILVNDKKIEIGILRSMGASSFSIAAIFGFCGMVMGGLGSLIGTAIALITLRNLQALIDGISQLQGHELFNPVFYGNILPNQVSFEALSFVILSTAVISLFAGVIPAIKASLLRPSTILRAE